MRGNNVADMNVHRPLAVGSAIVTAAQQTTLKEIGAVNVVQDSQYEGDIKVDYAAGNPGAAKTLTIWWYATNDTTTSVANLIKSLGGSASDGAGWMRRDITLTNPAPADPNPTFEIHSTVLRSTAKARLIFAYTLPAALDNAITFSVTLGLRG